MKLFLLSLFVIVSSSQTASASVKDVKAILSDKTILRTIGKGEIDQIQKIGARRYEVTFGRGCVLSASVATNCAGSACSTVVEFSSHEVNCLP